MTQFCQWEGEKYPWGMGGLMALMFKPLSNLLNLSGNGKEEVCLFSTSGYS